MKKSGFIIFLFLMFSCAYSQENANLNISLAVQKSLLQWLEKIPSGVETNFGFLNREEFSRATLETPIRVFEIRDDLLGQSGKERYLQPTGEWRIPVMVDQKFRSLVTVMKHNNEWEIVDFGAAGLASELDDFKRQLKAEQFRNIKLLRIYSLVSDFLFYDDPLSPADEIMLLPMQSASLYLESMNIQMNKTFTLDEVSKMVSESILLNNQDQ